MTPPIPAFLGSNVMFSSTEIEYTPHFILPELECAAFLLLSYLHATIHTSGFIHTTFSFHPKIYTPHFHFVEKYTHHISTFCRELGTQFHLAVSTFQQLLELSY